MAGQTREVDYLIVGGGVAGTTLARFLRDDQDVVVLEPRPGGYKVGESLIPEYFHHPVIRALVPKAKKLKSYAPKGGITFWSGKDVASFPLPKHGRAVAMHVARYEFEQLMHEEWDTPIVQERVKAIDLDTKTVTTDKGTWKVRKLICDCSGPAMVVARKCGQVDELWPTFARWTYFDLVDVDEDAFWAHLKATGARYRRYDVPNGFVLPENEDPDWHPSQQTIITQISRSVWTWQIPLYHEKLLSFGVVSRSDRIGNEELYALASKHHAPHYTLRRRPHDASNPMNRVHVRGRYARRARTPATMDYVLLGDAASFGDPLYSVGTGMAANKAIELAAVLNEEGWTEATCARWVEDYNALVDRSLEAFELWYKGRLLHDEESAKDVHENFLVGTAFQVGIATHYSQVLDDAHGKRDDAGPEGRGRHQVDPSDRPLTGEVAELLGLGDERTLGEWTLAGAFRTPTEIQQRWQAEGKPELVIHTSFDPQVTRYYRRVGRISLSFMNLWDGPYPFCRRTETLFDHLEARLTERESDWEAFGEEVLGDVALDPAVVHTPVAEAARA